MTKLWTKALMILVLVAPAGMIPADKSSAVSETPPQTAQMHGQPGEPFTLFPGGTAFGLSPNPLNGTIERQLRNDKVHDNKPSKLEAQARLVIAMTE
jgi:hypothetical protein